MSPLSLHELNTMVRTAVESSLSEPLWLQAELSSVSERGQHCYVEFVEKSAGGNGTLLAKARGQIWARTWLMLRPYFERTTGQPLCAGMKVMVRVEVTFHELYGYSLNIIDIDPAYTLGDLAKRRMEIIRQLREEGVADMNKTLPLPTLLRRIAVVSSESAAGWGDFRSQLLDNRYRLAFAVQLFPAIMQGERAPSSIIAALGQIYAEADRWDAVVIIRGGGATSDLSGFDSLSLAEHVAQFPLPIITGIGHERDDTVIDLVSHTRVKTPTAAAEFILHHQLQQMERIGTLSAQIGTHVTGLLHLHRMRLQNIVTTLPALATKQIGMKQMQIQTLQSSLTLAYHSRMERERHRIELFAASTAAAAPDHILRLGYSIVRHEGRAVTDASALAPDDRVQITFHQGSATATIVEQNK